MIYSYLRCNVSPSFELRALLPAPLEQRYAQLMSRFTYSCSGEARYACNVCRTAGVSVFFAAS